MLSAAGGWDGLAGEQICFPQGYYAASALEKEYAIVPVFLPPDGGDNDKFLAAFESQNCTAYAEDDGAACWRGDTGAAAQALPAGKHPAA